MTTTSSRRSKGSCDPHARLKVEVTGICPTLVGRLFAESDIEAIRVLEAGGYTSRGAGPHGDNENDYRRPENREVTVLPVLARNEKNANRENCSAPQ